MTRSLTIRCCVRTLRVCRTRNEPVLSFLGEAGKYYTVVFVDNIVGLSNDPATLRPRSARMGSTCSGEG